MGIYDKFSSDVELESRGVVLDFGNGEWVRIARAGGGNKKFLRLFEQLIKPHRRSISLGSMDDKKAEEVMHTVFAKTVVLDWHITGEDGADIPFSVENVVKVFQDLPEFFGNIKVEAENRANFKREQQEEESKN
jgi:ABC-type nitrate/sulfonate/bicarbonate transport system ATPase subunit